MREGSTDVGRTPGSAIQGESTGDGSPGGLVNSLWRDVRGVARDSVLLAALEARRAGRAFVRMVAYGIMAAILLVTSWLALVGAGVLAVTNAGAASLPGALVIAALLNIAVAAVMVWLIKRWDAQLLFVATLRRLREPDQPDMPETP
jgi:hypothetical protein